MTAPGTRPPPSTRSSSSTRVGVNCASEESTRAIGCAGVVTAAAALVRPCSCSAPISWTVPQAWHSPHRPTHLAVVQPHSVQR